MRRRGLFVFVLLILALLGPLPLSSQVDYSTATLKGTVLDPQELLVAGATVTVKNPSTGLSKVVQTGLDGSYRVPALPPGAYTIQIQASGFTTAVGNLALTVGQIAVYDVHLKLGSMNETVEVSEAAPLVQVEQTQQANTIGFRQVAELPNITRSFTESVFTLPGVAKSEAPRSQNPGFSGFQSSGFSIGGSNGRNNLVTIDGGENDYGSGQLRTPHVSVESIQEFQVNRSSFAAEFGFTAGTAVNIITRSGANDWHGSAYAYFRNEHTDAANYFAPKTPAKAFEQSFVPGFTFGGPIVKNKLFVFSSFEFVKEDTPQFRSYTSSPVTRITPAQVSYLGTMATVPALQPIATLLTQQLTPGNFPQVAQLLDPNTGAFNDWKKFHNLVTRLDYQPSENDTFTGRFSFMQDDSSRMYILDPLNSPDDATFQYWRDYTVLGSWNHIFSPRVVNQLRMQAVINTADVPVAAPNSAYLRIGSLGNFGGEHYEPYWARQKRFQFEDSMTWAKGSHSFKFGASYRPISYHLRDELWFGGEFQFYDGFVPIMSLLQSNPQAAAAVAAFNVQLGLPPTGSPDTNLTALQTYALGIPVAFRQGFGNPEWQDWAHYLGLYAQDSWKVARNFTLDIGGRLDYDAEASPVPHHTYFSPRLGFAWNPDGRQKTVVRGGGGIFVAPVPFYIGYIMNLLGDTGNYINQVAVTLPDQRTMLLWHMLTQNQRPPFPRLSQTQLESVGLTIGPGQPGRVVVELMPNYKNNYSVQGSLSVQRELPGNMAIEIAYQMYHGLHIQLPRDTNVQETGVIDPFVGPLYTPIDPTLTQIETYSSIGSSIYHGMTASLTRRFSRGLQFQVNYTFSKTIDDNTDFNNDFMPFRPTRMAAERSTSAFNIKHNFVANAVYALPFKHGGSFFSRLFADTTVSPIVFLRSGIPFTIRVPGLQNGTKGESLWARPWHAGRNSGIGPNFYSLDMRVTKSFYLKRESGVKVDFMAEGTNLFNHANFSAVNDFFPGGCLLPLPAEGCTAPVLQLGPNTLDLATGPYNLRGIKGLNPSDPLAFKAAFDPRQVQFGVKLIF